MQCSYCLFDGPDLVPSNEATKKRIESLMLDNYDFQHRSVLDIGSNSGLISLILASKMGANVFAIDVQETMVLGLKKFISDHNIKSIETSCFNFMDLDNSRSYDFVFFLEVLHWAVHQGHKIDAVLMKVASLTRGTLFIEFPWDANEPAIINQTQLKESDYSSYDIFRVLTSYFSEVRILGFQTYFDDPRSKRALVVCKK